MTGIEDNHPFQQLIISLVLGLLVGLQRQWADSPLGGIRTFALISLLGTICAFLADKYGAWIVAVGFLGTIAAMVAGDIAKKDKVASPAHSGLVTEFAMMLMFATGALVHLGPVWLAATLAGSLAVILQAKLELHGLVSRFTAKEIRAIMQFVLISLVILPLVPDKGYGPFGALNPHQTWLMVVLMVAISLIGYIIYKFHGAKAGVLLGGVLGGLISSTATTLTYAKRSKEEAKGTFQNTIIILVAWGMVYGRVAVEIAVVAPQFRAVWIPLGVMFLASALPTVWLWRQAGNHHKGMPRQDNPTELRMAILFGFLYSAVLFAAICAKNYLGTGGLLVVGVLSGLTEIDAITLSTARMVATGGLQQQEAWPVIISAILANTVFKGGLVAVWGGKAMLRKIGLPLVATIAAALVLLISG
ncbi:MAG: MgtC/SapB family protein [Alphaproteobacteria bacterium]|nr:MAG: MgtC/SapB family protein [Alphaproteobacteria bacterium]